jgi:hypothetical protein
MRHARSPYLMVLLLLTFLAPNPRVFRVFDPFKFRDQIPSEFLQST